MWNKIKCPCCKSGDVNINLQALANGKDFPCTSCGAVVSVSRQSQEVVQNGVDSFLGMQKKLADLD